MDKTFLCRCNKPHLLVAGIIALLAGLLRSAGLRYLQSWESKRKTPATVEKRRRGDVEDVQGFEEGAVLGKLQGWQWQHRGVCDAPGWLAAELNPVFLIEIEIEEQRLVIQEARLHTLDQVVVDIPAVAWQAVGHAMHNVEAACIISISAWVWCSIMQQLLLGCYYQIVCWGI